MPEPYLKPIPETDSESEPFFQGAREHKLMLMCCDACGHVRMPSRDRCDNCWSTRVSWFQASGRGIVYTFGIMHQLYHPGFKDELPYNVTVVELAEGPRMTTNLTGIANDRIQVGLPVEVTFEKITDDVTLPKFRPATGKA
ncbi:MAG: Zn-ribbon domain-containing OB-fold protein [Dehalococcoidia bacterium]